jgi:hypothetical protein
VNSYQEPPCYFSPIGSGLNNFVIARRRIRHSAWDLVRVSTFWLLLLCASYIPLPVDLCHAQGRDLRQPDILAMYLFNGADEATFRRQLENRAQLRVTRIAEAVGLNPGQLEKLQLATYGDLSRFYRELEHVRRKTQGLNSQNQNDMQKAWEFISPVQQRVAKGIIGEDSLTERILQSLLDDDQRAKYAEFQRQRAAAHFRSILRMTVSDLEKSLPLTEKQRDELIKLVEGKELAKPAVGQQQIQAYLGFIMLARLEDNELSELLDRQQVLTFRKLTQQYANMVPRRR